MRWTTGQSLASRFEPTTAGILVCFLLSGFAALLYETAWMRQFAIIFGTSGLAVAAVLASYMAGLALGAALIGRFVEKIRRPVVVYSLLEIGIAVTALAVPYGLQLARRLLIWYAGGQPNPPDGSGIGVTLYYVVATFVIIVIPTAFMGATLPLLTRYAVHSREQVGSRTGLLYAVNTAGAVLGTVVAAFVLLPRFGLHGTVYVGIAVNVVVFLLAMVIAWFNDRVAVTSSAAPVAKVARTWRIPVVSSISPILPIMLISGLISFTYEVLWTRLLGHLLGGSIYAFATMLAGFLSGITIGSAVASRLATTRERAIRGAIAAQIGTAIMAMLNYFAIDNLPRITESFGDGSVAPMSQVIVGAGMAFAILLPATLCIGASFPFAIGILAHDETDAARVSAQVYSWNTVGAISGALLAGFVLIPEIQFAGTAKFAVALNLALALGVALIYGRRRIPSLVTAVALVATVLLFRPSPPENLLRASPFSAAPAQGKVVYSAAGKNATVLLLEVDGSYDLRNDGLPEARIQPKGVPPAILNSDECLGAIPLMARPNAESLLVIGFGGGVTVAHAPDAIKEIDVIELEAEVVNANRKVAKFRDIDPLSDPRVRVIINDARGALALTSKRYDIICSQPSHPWTAGASHLFTTEFLSLAREHLKPGGVFVQWMHASLIDDDLLKTLGKTVLESFHDVRLYYPAPGLILFLASDEPLEPELQVARTGEPLKSDPAHFSKLAFNRAEDVCRVLLLDRHGLEQFCENAPANTDDMNLLATRTPGALQRGLSEQELIELIAPYDALVAEGSPIFSQSPPLIDAKRVARRLAVRGQAARALRIANAHLGPADRLFIEGDFLASTGKPFEAREKYHEAIEVDPTQQNARFEYVQGRLLENPADAVALAEAEKLQDPAKAIVKHMQNAVKGRWAEIAADETRLAAGEPGDQYSIYAARLRAGWRVYLKDSRDQKKRAREAMEILDQELAYGSDAIVLTIRFHAAVVLRQPEMELETAATLAAALEQMQAMRGGQITPDVMQYIRYSVPAVLPDLARLRNNPRVSAERVDNVGAKLQALYQQAAR